MMMVTIIAAAGIAAILPGTYTNEEQVYFATEAGKSAPPWTGLRIAAADGGYRLQPVDAFDKPAGEAQRINAACFEAYRADGEGYVADGGDDCGMIAAVDSGGIILRSSDGEELKLDRAQAFTCWTAIRKRQNKPDGGEDWYFTRGIALHDAGGRAQVTSDEPKPQSVVLRMRDVAWSSGPNRPSLVLYIHTDDPARAAAYAWADPGALRVGVNLRWMQASCTRVGSE